MWDEGLIMLEPGQILPEAETSMRDESGMWQALLQAERARELDEVPVGAVVVDAQGLILGVGYNRTITDHDPTAMLRS